MRIHPYYSKFELFAKRLQLAETNPEFQLMRYKLAHMSALVYNKKMYFFFINYCEEVVYVNALD